MIFNEIALQESSTKGILMNINYINGIVVGYLLVNWAIVLNILVGNKLGIVFAVISMASAYILESIRCANDDYITSIANKLLGASMIISTFLSYFSWLSY